MSCSGFFGALHERGAVSLRAAAPGVKAAKQPPATAPCVRFAPPLSVSGSSSGSTVRCASSEQLTFRLPSRAAWRDAAFCAPTVSGSFAPSRNYRRSALKASRLREERAILRAAAVLSILACNVTFGDNCEGFHFAFSRDCRCIVRESAPMSRVACEPPPRGCFSGPGIPCLLGGYHSGALVATPVHAAVGVQRCGQALRPKGNL